MAETLAARANVMSAPPQQTWFIDGRENILAITQQIGRGSLMRKPDTKVLVAYDSKLGSTAEVAKFMGSVLLEQGASITVGLGQNGLL